MNIKIEIDGKEFELVDKVTNERFMYYREANLLLGLVQKRYRRIELMKRILLATYDKQDIDVHSVILLYTPFYEDRVSRKDIQNNMILCGAYTRTSSYVPKGIPAKSCIWVEYNGYYGKEVYILQERIPHSAWRRTILAIPEENADEE